ncbi:hypothetical protein Vadar_014588 [Vaccinium darrowii]|uniref:Uncharacterized protein n=1 Tax=Vaccinium darrowii TaxID=229202 RepID=A0ACB7ZCL6_9ERIC|nr:hypothetical protein Vadar_014588 [Vaccinium darrowii]
MSSEKSSDDKEFEVQHSVAMMSTTLKNMIEDDCMADIVPVANINGKTLAVLIEYCKKYTTQKPQEQTPIADMCKGKTPEEIRKTFKTANDFTPEEEEEVRNENPWAFE